MPDQNDLSYILPISSEEIAKVDRYRKLKDTSVLTIMFTDIKGFTQLTEEKGEHYSKEVRELHNNILVPTIQEDEGGLVIKHIGDSIMAVFSEPSTAVARALKIQEKLKKFNSEHSEFDNIEVRIGLDMGQVAIENEVHMDMFGRHVNRASRVEELADGGQIYLTYPVFDSAKGWLASQTTIHLEWKLHGKYYLKGIKTPIEIYEILDKQHGKPRPPAKGKKKRAIPAIGISLLLLLLGIGLTLSVLQIKKTSVWFVNMQASEVYLDHDTKIILGGDSFQQVRKSLNKIPPGKHLLHTDIHWQVKYYSEITVKRGKNYIEPKFVEVRLPSLSRHLMLTYNKGKYFGSTKASRKFEYFVYDKTNQKKNHQAIIDFTVKGKSNSEKAGQVVFDLDWKVKMGNKIISQDQKIITNFVAKPKKIKEKLIIYTDDEHYYYVSYYVFGISAELALGAAYIEYKDK